MKKNLLLALVAASFTFTACTDSGTSVAPAPVYQAPTDAKMAKFKPVMTEVALSTRNDPNYHKMTIKPEDKEWFQLLMYRFWDRQMTKSQFIAEGVSRYPGHAYEFNFIANGFQKRS